MQWVTLHYISLEQQINLFPFFSILYYFMAGPETYLKNSFLSVLLGSTQQKTTLNSFQNVLFGAPEPYLKNSFPNVLFVVPEAN